jgi:hypothetical protein
VQAAAFTSDFPAIAGGIAALIAAIGGARAAIVAAREYRLKSAAQRVEIDVQLSKLLAELAPIANGRGPAVVSEAVAETIAQAQVGKGASPAAMEKALEPAVMTMPVGEATQAAAIASIGYLGAEHESLSLRARQALLALDFVDDHPKLAAARKAALAMIDP